MRMLLIVHMGRGWYLILLISPSIIRSTLHSPPSDSRTPSELRGLRKWQELPLIPQLGVRVQSELGPSSVRTQLGKCLSVRGLTMLGMISNSEWSPSTPSKGWGQWIQRQAVYILYVPNKARIASCDAPLSVTCSHVIQHHDCWAMLCSSSITVLLVATMPSTRSTHRDSPPATPSTTVEQEEPRAIIRFREGEETSQNGRRSRGARPQVSLLPTP